MNRHRMLCFEALRWLNFTEKGGNNKGQIVEMFQKAVDDKAQGEPWCMSFTQFCMKQVDSLITYITQTPQDENQIFRTEHCFTAWRLSPLYCRNTLPQLGFLAIWKSNTGSNGHTGIVVKLDKDPNIFWTVEGNTSPDSEGSQRDGDGVFLKKRQGAIGNLDLIGFLNPWPDIKPNHINIKPRVN